MARSKAGEFLISSRKISKLRDANASSMTSSATPTPFDAEQMRRGFRFEMDLHREVFSKLYAEASAEHDEFFDRTIRDPLLRDGKMRELVTPEEFALGASRDVKAGIIAIVLNALIQDLAERLGLKHGEQLRAGEDAFGEPLTRIMWATSNNARHVYEWQREGVNGRTKPSMEILAKALSDTMPIQSYTSYAALSQFGGETYDLLEERVIAAADEMIDQRFPGSTTVAAQSGGAP